MKHCVKCQFECKGCTAGKKQYSTSPSGCFSFKKVYCTVPLWVALSLARDSSKVTKGRVSPLVTPQLWFQQWGTGRLTENTRVINSKWMMAMYRMYLKKKKLELSYFQFTLSMCGSGSTNFNITFVDYIAKQYLWHYTVSTRKSLNCRKLVHISEFCF